MSVLGDIYQRVEAGQRMHMTLVDPDKQSAQGSAHIASQAESAGSDAIMVGGSTGVTGDLLDQHVLAMKEEVRVPIIHFPTQASALSHHMDAIYFMSLLNATDLRFLTREQMRAAPIIKEMGLEAIPMGYCVVEPGMNVGKVARAEPVPKDRPDLAVGYALASELLGMKLFYLEAGSGSPTPVPPEMVRQVKQKLSIPLVVGGGIRSREKSSQAAAAGADIVVTGTIVEKVKDVEKVLQDIVAGVKEQEPRSMETPRGLRNNSHPSSRVQP